MCVLPSEAIDIEEIRTNNVVTILVENLKLSHSDISILNTPGFTGSTALT